MKDLNASEKAKELIEKFFDIGLISYSKSKQCALIQINALIIQNGELYLNGLDGTYYRQKNRYLFDVKSEIEKL
jgi:hypothetical protein